MDLFVSDFQKCVPSLELICPDSYELPIDSIGITDGLSDNQVCFIGNEKYAKKFADKIEQQPNLSNIGILLDKTFVAKIKDKDPLWKLLMKNSSWIGQIESVPYSMSKISKLYYDRDKKLFNDEVDGRQMGTVDIHPSARIAQNVFIGANVRIGPRVRLHPGVVILSQSEIGEECELFPNVVVYPKVIMKKRVRIHASAVIGADGFGYRFASGTHHKIWHTGTVILEDDVEIGASTSVDRGTFGATRIGKGSKLDNQVHIGHNVSLGEGVILCGQTGVGGSSRLGDFTIVGGKAGFADNVDVGKKSQIAGGSIVTAGCWKDGSALGGHPARPLKEWLRSLAWLRKMSLKDNPDVD